MWTEKDEEALAKLTERKTAHDGKRAALRQLMNHILGRDGELNEMMIAHASEVRAALAPFDSSLIAQRYLDGTDYSKPPTIKPVQPWHVWVGGPQPTITMGKRVHYTLTGSSDIRGPVTANSMRWEAAATLGGSQITSFQVIN